MTAVHGRFTRSQTLIQNGQSQHAPFLIPVRSCAALIELSMLGGEIDCVDKDGNTPLHIAARYGHELLINSLITSGADCTRSVGSPRSLSCSAAAVTNCVDCCFCKDGESTACSLSTWLP